MSIRHRRRRPLLGYTFLIVVFGVLFGIPIVTHERGWQYGLLEVLGLIAIFALIIGAIAGIIWAVVQIVPDDRDNDIQPGD